MIKTATRNHGCTDDDDANDDDKRTMCGQVFRNENGSYEYFCTVCPMQTAQANQFELHVSMHFQIEFVSSAGAAIVSTDVTIKQEQNDDNDVNVNVAHSSHSSDGLIEKSNCDDDDEISSEMDNNVEDEDDDDEQQLKPFCQVCIFCDKVYDRASSLLSHLRRVHKYTNAPELTDAAAPDPIRRMDCDICGASFDGPQVRGLFTYHIRDHMAAKRGRRLQPQQCTFCAKVFSFRRAFKDHMLTHTDERPYRCDICQKGFNAASTLKNHKARHSSGTNAVCDECGQSFTAQYQLYSHIFNKHRPKSYTCTVCEPPKLFNAYNAFKYHRQSEHGKERFRCDTCGKTFKLKKCMQQHRQVHSGERPYLCRYCGKAFSQSQGKRAHERRMHEEVLVMKNSRS